MNIGFSQKENSIYFNGALDLGNYVGVELGITYVVDNKYSFSFGWLGEIHGIENYPSDL